jgi:hypothetical protein
MKVTTLLQALLVQAHLRGNDESSPSPDGGKNVEQRQENVPRTTISRASTADPIGRESEGLDFTDEDDLPGGGDGIPERYLNIDGLPLLPPSAQERARVNTMSTERAQEVTKTIYMSGGFDEMWPKQVMDSCPHRCKVKTIERLRDTSQLVGADAVVFNTAFSNKRAEFVSTDWTEAKQEGQLWILSDYFEAVQREYQPAYVKVAKSVDFLMSMNTFDASSPFWCPMFTVDNERDPALSRIPSKYTGPIQTQLAQGAEKPILVTWGTGHCGTSSHREGYAKRLRKALEKLYRGTDREVWFQYGGCNYNTDESWAEHEHVKCDVYCTAQKISQSKFYFAGENRLCDGYMTEKQLHGLAHGAVPLVYADISKENQELRYPPNSFISTYDFDTPEALAHFIYHLDHNDAAYNKYHAWRETHMVSFGCHKAMCSVCEAAHNPDSFAKYRPSEDVKTDWWVEKPKCVDPPNLWWENAGAKRPAADDRAGSKRKQKELPEQDLAPLSFEVPAKGGKEEPLGRTSADGEAFTEEADADRPPGRRSSCESLALSGFDGNASSVGTRVSRILNGLGVAEKLGLSLKIPGTALGGHMRGIFRFAIPPGKDAAEIRVDEDPDGQEQCHLEKGSVREALSTCESEFEQARCISSFEHRVRLAEKYLRPRLDPQLAKCAENFARGSDRKLVVHLRGSATSELPQELRDFEAESNSCHEQPWCSFYDTLLDKSKDVKTGKTLYDQVLIVSDGWNPCQDHIIQHHGKRQDLRINFTDGSLLSDSCALLGAKHIVWGRSATSALFMTLNPTRDSVFVPLISDKHKSSCSAWNLNRGVCPYVKRGLFWNPPEWELTGHDDRFAGDCDTFKASRKKNH